MELNDLELPELVVGRVDVSDGLVAQLLDTFATGQTVSGRSAHRRASVASSARRQRAREKARRLELRQQAKTLETQLELLRQKHKKRRGDAAIAQWAERAAMQERKREQAEMLNQQLKEAVIAQRGFLRGFLSVAAASELSNELNLSALLHTFTQLRKDASSRLQEMQRLFAEQQLDLATRIVLQETHGVAVDSCNPTFHTQQIQTGAEEFAVTSTAVFAVDTVDVAKISLAACSAYLQRSDPDWLEYTFKYNKSNSASLPTPRVRYNTCTATYKTSQGQEVTLEGRGISSYRVSEDNAVIVWDFVDTDELYPLQAGTDVKRDTIGVVVIRRELCGDGAERVVLRSIGTKLLRLYSLKNAIISQDVIQAPEKTMLGMRASMTRAYDAIQESHRNPHGARSDY